MRRRLVSRLWSSVFWEAGRDINRFQLKKETSIIEHMNNYTKFLADLANVDEVIKNEDKALILLIFLLDDDYETSVLTFFNVINHLATMRCRLLLWAMN